LRSTLARTQKMTIILTKTALVHKRGLSLHLCQPSLPYNGLCSAPEPTKRTKSSIKKAAKLARTERKRRQKLEAREKAKLGLSDEPGTPDEPVALLEETTSENEDRPSEDLEILRPATSVPAEVQPDISVTATPQNDVPRPPPPRPVANNEQIRGIETSDMISTVEQLPLLGSATEVEAPAGKNSAMEAEKVKKRQNVLNRVFWSLVMIGGFIGMFPISSTGRHD
jgi:phosphatidate cytidylyltransferase